jgi:hypothetical protein
MGARRRKRTSQLDTGKDLQMQAFSEAADGIRTHDLLHGKQNLRRRFHMKYVCKQSVCALRGP